jgi:hypothetical protein
MANNALRNELEPVITSVEIEIVSNELLGSIKTKVAIIKDDEEDQFYPNLVEAISAELAEALIRHSFWLGLSTLLL